MAGKSLSVPVLAGLAFSLFAFVGCSMEYHKERDQHMDLSTPSMVPNVIAGNPILETTAFANPPPMVVPAYAIETSVREPLISLSPAPSIQPVLQPVAPAVIQPVVQSSPAPRTASSSTSDDDEVLIITSEPVGTPVRRKKTWLAPKSTEIRTEQSYPGTKRF